MHHNLFIATLMEALCVQASAVEYPGVAPGKADVKVENTSNT